MIKIFNYSSPVGVLIIGEYEGKLCMLDWQYRKQRAQIDQRIQNYFQTEFKKEETLLHLQTIQQLEEYFNKKRKTFELELILVGTDFQKQVWTALCQIPYGKTVSYLQLSQQIGNEKAIRAVASANGANAISIIIPCHRVIGSNGALTGYAGGLTAKRKLLEIENSITTPTLFD
ncbi:MAG TPA: methylated-DNA--[protein]-cysteine S-methyltransferase [Edaphocola sp.]|nr:methylated-DNA--[protein]-cysteine S-methyltransferase [Edaphocola sp.]